MNDQELSAINKEIAKCSKTGKFQYVYDKYCLASHPDINYNLGIHAYNLDYMKVAAEQFFLGAVFGMQYPNKYYDSLYSNSIGQCYSVLLTAEFNLNADTNFGLVTIRKMTCIAYLYLSKCISTVGNRAYDSMAARAELLTKHNHPNELINVFDAYNVPYTSLPILSAADYKDASKGYFMRSMSVVEECLENADFCFSSFQKSNNVKAEREELEAFGREYHTVIFSTMESNYKNGLISLTTPDLQLVLSHYA